MPASCYLICWTSKAAAARFGLVHQADEFLAAAIDRHLQQVPATPKSFVVFTSETHI
ncbi:MAG: hypothetical protein ACE5HO_01610 [bacterium]